MQGRVRGRTPPNRSLVPRPGRLVARRDQRRLQGLDRQELRSPDRGLTSRGAPGRDKGFEKVDSTNSKMRSGIGGPIRLSDFQPVACEALARIGSANDGGYVVPLDAVMAARALVSFGLSHDWTFERDFKKYNADAIIHCYDHTVSL